MTIFQRRVGAFSALLLFAVVGCTEADRPTATPTPSATPKAPTPSATPSAPEPTERTEPETAKQFIRRWPLVETEMINTGETAAYRGFTRGCQPCQRLAGQIEGFYGSGGYAKTQGWVIQSIKGAGRASGLLEFTVKTRAQATEYQAAATATVERLPGGPRSYQVILKKGTRGWTLFDAVDLGAK